MNNTTKTLLIITAIVLLVLIITLARKQKEKSICYNLPTNVDPTVFGPSYWAAFHDLAHKIPCEGCRTFAEKFMIYFHDVVNIKLNKPVFNQANYDEMKSYVCSL